MPSAHDPAALDAAVARVLTGDREAFASVVDAGQDAVWRVAAQLLQDRALTEELVQSAFVRAYERLATYVPGTDLIAWLVTIARNVVRNHLRDRQRERQRLHLYQEDLLARSGAVTEWKEEDERLQRDLAACRALLPGDAQEALRLFYAESLPIAAIATRLGRSEAAAQKLLSRVRLSLRDCVQRKLTST